MTTEQITKGMGLLLAATAECEAMAETARRAIRYCYDRDLENRTLSPQRIRRFPADSPHLDAICAGGSGAVLRRGGSGPGYGAGNAHGYRPVLHGIPG